MASRFQGLTLGSTLFSESSGADHVNGAHCKTISIYMYLPKITISPLIYSGVWAPPISVLYFLCVNCFGSLVDQSALVGRPVVSIGW